MPSEMAPQLAKALIEKGMSAHMPVLIAKAVSRACEEMSYCRLRDLKTLDIDRTQPVLLGIGRVFETHCLAYEALNQTHVQLGELYQIRA